MDEFAPDKTKRPVSGFSIALIILMLAVTIFLILTQNIDRFSDYFGGTTFKIVFDVALISLFILLIAYVFNRSAAYHKELEGMVKRLQDSNMLLQVLNAIQSSANSTMDTRKFLGESLETVMKLISSRGTIYLIEDETSRLKPLACYGTETGLENMPDYAIGEGIIGWVAQNGQPLEDNTRTGRGSGSEREPARTSRAHIALPIKAGNKVMGVMFADTVKGSYSQEEKTLLHTVTEVMGNSLTNTKLFDITRRALDTSRRSQSYLESFILAAEIGVLVLDVNGVALVANQEAERYLQVQLKDILGKNTAEVLNGSGWRGQRLVQGITGCLNDRLSARYSHPMDDDPNSLAMLVSVFPLFKDKDELIGAATTFMRT